MPSLVLVLLIVTLTPVDVSAAGGFGNADPELRARIEAMKSAPRGPFSRIRWFCKDGTVLPPRPYACKPHGGGSQHGEWTDEVKTLRADGFFIANLLADLDVDELVATPGYEDRINQILIEQFLITIDDGWILRRARFYRGALQEESERAGARRLLHKLAADERWLDQGFAALRVAARSLRHGPETGSVTEVRQLSASLSKQDPEFGPLRNKIHVRPDAGDAASVRQYADGVTNAEARAEYERLAALIDEVYSAASATSALRELATQSDRYPTLQAYAREGADRLQQAVNAADRFTLSASLLAGLRERLQQPDEPALRLLLLDTSLRVEDEHYTAASALRATADRATRAQALAWLAASIDAIYGAGQLRDRQRQALHHALGELEQRPVSLASYKRTLDYLSLVPAWASQRLRYHFFASMQKLNTIEPLVILFVQDLLRGSPTFFYAQFLDELLRDANGLAGVRRELLGENVGGGLRGLNPGLARGTLYLGHEQTVANFHQDGIYVLPETVSDLPPVAGILTAGEGNPLSHVQLLARNLGIPNVGVDERLVERIAELQGQRVVLAVSAAGSVELTRDDTRWDPILGNDQEQTADILIKPDLDKLDLEQKSLLKLSELRASDSGRTVGPKAAKLGELYHHYPDAVAEGLTIPFGVFRELLEQPMADTGDSVYQWMVKSYRHLESLPAGSAPRIEQTEVFRARLYDWIVGADPGERFRERLREALSAAFGDDGSYGVFVRSDTNVEDLPGFTGAGLNLTVPNVVGFDNIVAAIPKVWASPFTARAFSWRQSHMDQPEHVYPAVLLMRSVPADKSGVLVTQDVDSGDRNWLSVAVNEGVGGAVDGQAAESLRIHVGTGQVRLMAQATAPIRRRVSLQGGVDKIPVSGADEVLNGSNIGDLIEFARELPQRFPAIVDADGQPAPADIEFGFLNDELKLFQIRPFLESSAARSSAYLKSLDQALGDLNNIEVDLDTVPGG